MATDSRPLIYGYFLEGSDDEICLVVKSEYSELIHKIIRRMTRMRQKDIRKMGRNLDEEFNDRF